MLRDKTSIATSLQERAEALLELQSLIGIGDGATQALLMHQEKLVDILFCHLRKSKAFYQLWAIVLCFFCTLKAGKCPRIYTYITIICSPYISENCRLLGDQNALKAFAGEAHVKVATACLSLIAHIFLHQPSILKPRLDQCLAHVFARACESNASIRGGASEVCFFQHALAYAKGLTQHVNWSSYNIQGTPPSESLEVMKPG